MPSSNRHKNITCLSLLGFISSSHLKRLEKMMRKLSLLLITSLALMLSACNDDNDSDNSSPTTPPTSNCKMHCAP
ncbi:hypothetical protein [Acinetobacter sp. WU_MDCI_Abxb74]|uniref:hypothetical protein n=1 Tax=Acinetobacter sp. WU_MDCI_Abxb74 TaxID=2850072 RepID=UPI0021CDE11F|nr:hypothetical protein [Acinetobacter sp. WU_MDCI_Abxb74]MCU4425338.1 hypothetical protein [Acinetobacter sp. WU_MDCI_Abxb74]